MENYRFNFTELGLLFGRANRLLTNALNVRNVWMSLFHVTQQITLSDKTFSTLTACKWLYTKYREILNRIHSDLNIKFSHQPFRRYGIDDATLNDLKIK